MIPLHFHCVCRPLGVGPEVPQLHLPRGAGGEHLQLHATGETRHCAVVSIFCRAREVGDKSGGEDLQLHATGETRHCAVDSIFCTAREVG